MKSSRHTSLKDLAQALGVSVSTVSRALKGSSEISISMRERVQALARNRNYQPNPFALGLLKNRPKMIGIIVPDIVTHFYSSIISGINDVARRNGYFAIITSSYEQFELEKKCIEDLVNTRVEGILVCLSQETKTYDHFERLAEIDMPLLFFDRVALTDRFSSVVSDNAESAQISTEHLLANGAQRIGFIGGANHLEIVRLRKQGYLKAMRERGNVVDRNLVVCEELSFGEGREATKKLLSLPNPPDAILAMNDTLAFAAMQEIKAHGLRIPEDIALVGYTDEMHAEFMEPQLTAVTHQTHRMGVEACKLLLEQIEMDQVTPKQIIIPTRLYIRKSSCKGVREIGSTE